MTTEKTEVTTEVAADDFDAAFAEAIAAEGSGEPASGKPAEKEKAEAAATAAATEAEVKAEEKATADAEKAVADKAAADAAAAAATPEGKAAAEAAAKATADAEKAAADKAAADAAAAKKAAEDKAATDAAEKERKAALEIPEPVLTDDQKKILDAFEKEWPDIATAMKVQQTHALAQMEARFARALTAVVEKMYSDIDPVFRTVQNVEQSTFRSEVLKKHADFDEVSPKLEAWIGAQPAYLIDAYKKVYNEGSVQEVIELVSQYKKANGTGPQASGTPPASSTTTDQQTAAARAAAAEKARSLAPVQSKRSTPTPQGSDPNDFDGAFEEAAAALSK